MITVHKQEVDAFLEELEKAATRRIERVLVLPLHGKETEHATLD